MRITGIKKRSMALVLAFTLILMLAATAVPALAAPADSPYCLWVGGTPVTAGNAADIPAAYPAERTGKAAYDSGSNTLTLTDYRCTDFSCDGQQGVIHYAGTDPLKIVLAGSSAVSAGGGSVTCGIFSTGPLEISGTGLLTATGADGAFEKSYGVLFAESLTIKSGTVCAAGGDTETFTDSDAISCGLFCTHGSVQIDGGTVIARGGETNQKSGSLSAGIAADLIKIQGGTVRASGAAANASYGLKAMLNEEYLAALSRQAEGLEKLELKVEALRYAEKVQREAIAATNKPELTLSNYYESYARPLAEAMIEYKLVYDGMTTYGVIQTGNLHTGWYGNNWYERRYVVKYLDKNLAYHEEYYTYATCGLDGTSLSREDTQQTINGIQAADYAPGVSGINVQKKNAVQTSTLLASKETFRNVPLNGVVYAKITCDRYNFEFDRDDKGRMTSHDYYSAADYDRDVALRQSEQDAIPGYGITVGAAAASVEAASANATAVRGEVKNAIEGNGWTAADADPAGIGVSDDVRALETPYQRIVFGLTPEAKEFTVDDIDAPTYTGSALTPAVTVRDSEDATLQLAAGTDYTVAYTNNVDATTSAQKAKATVTGLGAYYGCTVEKEFDIDPSPVTLCANSATATYNGSEMIVTGFTCLKDGQTLGGLTFAGVSASGSGTNADTYEVTFSGVTLGQTRDTTGNYVVTGTENGLLTVDPKPIAYAGETNISFTYNGKAQQKTFMLGGRELELGNDFTVVIKDGDDRTVPEMKNAGTYYETFTGKGNYSGEWSLTVTIGKAALTVTADSAEKTYDGTALTAAGYTSTELIAGDSIQSVTVTGSRTGFGTGANVPSAAVIKNADNEDVTSCYEITYVNGTLTVAKADPTCTAPTGLTATYGQTLADVTLTNPSGNTAGTWAWVDDTTSVGDAGTKTFKANYTPADTTNYNTVENVDVTVKVNQPEITPTVTLEGWTYGQEPNAPSVSGNVGNGTVTYTYATKDSDNFSATVPTNAGNYTVKATIAATTNYNGATATADFTIATADSVPATVTANKLTCDGTEKALVTVTGEVAGGEMQYALGKDAQTAPEDGWSTDIPAATNTGTYYVWYKVVGDENHKDTAPAYVTTVIKGQISATVTFKVVNGSWNDGEAATADRTVTLTGKEGDVLKLTADQIPAVGDKPADGYKTGAWNVTPSTEVEIKEDTTFIYTYAEKSGISATVTFKVVNGSWNDGEGGAATSDRTVVLTGKEGDVLKLTAEQIPAVGAKPGEGYQAGAWDVTPSTETEIKENTTFIYTYAALKGKSISYRTYEGEGGEYKHGSDGTLTFVFKRSEADSETFAHFTGLKYDGRSLTRDKDYTAKAGSVIITLDHELLESMMVGNHILTAVFDDGEADAHFTVIANAEPTATPTAAPTATPTPTPTPKPVPKTGDNSNPVLWLAMMILGLAVLAGTAVKVYRKRQ